MAEKTLKKVKTILVSQPKPEGDKSPYADLAKKLNLKVDFRPFIQVDPVPVKEFRNQRVHVPDFTGVIFNSKNSVDAFFKMMEEMRITLPEDMKYFCITEAIENYIQKFVQVRKRKLFHARNGTEADLLTLLKNHPSEKYFFPCSDIRKPVIPDFLTKHKIFFKEGMIYRTVSADLSDLADVYYDIICFYSPADIKSLFENFPDFKQNQTRIAAWGKTTIQAVEDANLLVNIPAPTPEAPSMTMALEKYIVTANKG
jgi:uroporphyrinogen-III synthase